MHFSDIIDKNRKNINFTEEFFKIRDMYENRNYLDWNDEIKGNIKDIFIYYHYKGRFITLDELERCVLKSINILPELLTMNNSYVDLYISSGQLLVYSEYVYNLICFLKTYMVEHQKDMGLTKDELQCLSDKIKFLLQYIKMLLSDMSIEIIHRNDIYFFVDAEEKKKIDVVLSVNKEFDNIDYLYEYIHIQNKNDLTKKREILKLLANDYEKYESKIEKANKQLKSNIGYILNNYNIRHENLNKNSNKYKEKLEKISNEKFVEIYDKLFEMFICALSLTEVDKYNNYVEQLKKDFV